MTDIIREIRKGGLSVSDAYKLSDKYATKIDNLYNSNNKKKKCFCEAEFDGVTCNSCGDDNAFISEVLNVRQ